MAHVEDRWHRAVTGPSGRTRREKTARYGKGLRWRVRYTGPDGKEHGKSFARQDDAAAFRATVETDILRGSYIDPSAGKVTLRGFGEGWVAAHGGEATTRERVRERCRVHIFPALGHYPLAQLAQRPSIIQGWLSQLPLAPNYKRAVFIHLSAMLSAAVDDGLIPRNPCKAKSVTLPRPPRRVVVPWTAVQVAAVRAAMPGRYQIAADLGAGLGMRQGEVFGLAVDDIGWLAAHPQVHIRRQVRIVGGRLVFAPPKGGRERDSRLPETVKLRLSAHLAAFPATRVTLPWLEPGGKPVSARLVLATSARTALNRAYFGQYIWRPAVETAGIARTHADGFHALRHHFASMALASGMNIRKLAAHLGHSSPGFTLSVYAHLIPDEDGSARQAIDGILLPLERPSDGPAATGDV